MTDVHGDRLEAAAMALAEVDGGNFFAEPVGYRGGAREILAAADAQVTVEMIAQVIRRVDGGRNLGAGEIAEAVHALLTGGEA